MKERTRWAAILLFVHAAIAAAASQEAEREAIAVIAARADHDVRVDATQMNLIYRRKLRFWADGRRMHPINLPVAHPLRQRFSRSILDSAPEALSDYWRERYFLGIEPPFVVHSTEAMIRIVAQTSGAIGYISACDVDDRVSVLMYVDGETGRSPCPSGSP